MSWREGFAKPIADTIADGRRRGLGDKAIRRELRKWFLQHCSSGAEYWPEKVYRNEVRRQLAGETGLQAGRRAPIVSSPGQLGLTF